MDDKSEEQQDSYAWEIDLHESPVNNNIEETRKKHDVKEEKGKQDKQKVLDEPEKHDESERYDVFDSRGRLFVQGKKKPRGDTQYEIWLAEKRKSSGVEVRCPNCGTVNIDLPFVVGQKCTECKYKLGKGENVGEKMKEFDVKRGKHKNERITEISPSVMKLSLDLPDFIINDPNARFHWTFSSQSYLVYLIVSMIAAILAIAYWVNTLDQVRFSFFDYLFVIFFIVVAIFAFHGFMQLSSVTKVELNEIGARFYGAGRPVEITYDKINSITTRRILNGKARMASFMFPGSWRYFFFGSRLLPYYHHSWMDTADCEPFDSSSSSPYYTNQVSIRAGYQSVDWFFSGGSNLGFVRALAIILYMARQRNSECFVDIDSLKASDKIAKTVV